MIFTLRGEQGMAKCRTDHNKERVKLYKKVRNTSSWRSILLYLLMMLLFIAAMVFLSGFVLEYIFETKFAEGYAETQHIAKLYEVGSEDHGITGFIESEETEFIVKDQGGKIVYQKGENTCTFNGGIIKLANGSETCTVYEDSELGFIYHDGDDGLNFKLMKFLRWYDKDAETVRLPIWVSIDLSGGRKFIGKAYLTLTSRDAILILELLSGLVLIVVIVGVITVVKIIKSAVNYRRVVRLFYSDPITYGHNWIWYVRYGDDRLQSSFCKKDSFAVVNMVFRNYRNYCLCHSISEGEELLARIHRLIAGEMKKHEMCAHATTSNFAMLLKYTDEQQLRQRLEDIISKLKDMDSDHNFDFQIGVDLVPPNKAENGRMIKRKGFSIENAYNNACSARAELGDTEESGVRIFDSRLLEEKRWRDTVYEHQSSALKNEEFVVYYQPKYDPRTNELRGAEALVRWDSPEYGFVTPGRIIPIFEKNGFITEIDHYMISHVAKDQKAWLDAGYKCVPVSVNVSRAHFIETDLAEQIRDIVDEAQCPHDLIEIELTESAFFDDKKAMIETIKKLKDYGFTVSMDDFGAGYSSLNSLKDMPLDVLKLDADFFRGESAGERGEIVVSEAIKLAKSLEMRTVAEGVEEKDQVEFLAKQGCDMIQGFYFAKPMPKAEYETKMTAPEQPESEETQPQPDE